MSKGVLVISLSCFFLQVLALQVVVNWIDHISISAQHCKRAFLLPVGWNLYIHAQNDQWEIGRECMTVQWGCHLTPTLAAICAWVPTRPICIARNDLGHCTEKEQISDGVISDLKSPPLTYHVGIVTLFSTLQKGVKNIECKDGVHTCGYIPGSFQFFYYIMYVASLPVSFCARWEGAWEST